MIYDEPCNIFQWFGNPKDGEIMQFTGLYDKHDNHIYEGDVYIVYNNYDCRVGEESFIENSEKLQVIYKNGAFCGGINIKLCGPLSWEGDDNGECIEDAAFISSISVIGNIFENSELILTW